MWASSSNFKLTFRLKSHWALLVIIIFWCISARQFVSKDWVCVNALLKISPQMILAIPIIAPTFAYLATSYDSILSTPIYSAICAGVLLKIILALPIFTTAWNNWQILWIMIFSHTHMTATSIKGNTHTFALATPTYQSLI